MANNRGWGQDATLAPGWERVGQAAWNAAASPITWGPAAAAFAFQTGRADRNLQKWAAEKTPVFGSRERADRMSYDLRDAAGVIWVASGMATPGGDRAGDWTVNKVRGLGMQTGAGIVTRGAVGALKSGTDRTRPNGVDQDGFPSAHATGSALYSTFASRNLETMRLPGMATAASDVSLGVLTAATAWARVEANQHFPSDVLAGIALGHFFGAFVSDAFMGLDEPGKGVVLFEPLREGAAVMVRFGF
jgi:membrane-associated phospholipid phosphatase